MSNRRPERIIDTKESAGGDCEQTVLPPRLLRGIRKAMDGGKGRLRMDPQELANRLGALIDLEVERLRKVRKEYQAQRRTRDLLDHPPVIFGSGNAVRQYAED